MTQLPNYVDRMLHVRRARLNFRSFNVIFAQPLPVPRFLTSACRTRMTMRQSRFTLVLVGLVFSQFHLQLLT